MPDEHYVNPMLAKIYDLDSPWSADRDFYLALAGQSSKTILDLGCGTGLLCNAYAAKGHEVTGVDPSAVMLELGRQKSHGHLIDWVQSSSQSYQSGKLFDLIIMTGHAFQVLLEDVDVLETFSTMRKHLKPGGLIVFESRNPDIDWASQWNYDMEFELPQGIVHESRRFLAMENDRMQFELRYQFPDQTLVSTSELRFMTCREIETYLVEADLFLDKVLGDWDGKPFDEIVSHEMIFLIRGSLN